MKSKFNIKKQWWIILIILWLLFIKYSIYDPSAELNAQKKLLMENEKTILPVLERCSTIEEKLEKLKKVKEIKTLYQKSNELNQLLEKIITPVPKTESEIKYNYKSGNNFVYNDQVYCPIQLEIESSFNFIGDYLEYLESLYLPISISDIKISPSKNEFDIITIQLAGNILLSN